MAAVHNATNLKIGFRVKHPKEAKEIAEAIIPLDLGDTGEGTRQTDGGRSSANLFRQLERRGARIVGPVDLRVDVRNDHRQRNRQRVLVSDNSGWSTTDLASQNRTQSYDGWGVAQIVPNQTTRGTASSTAAGRSGGSATATSTGTQLQSFRQHQPRPTTTPKATARGAPKVTGRPRAWSRSIRICRALCTATRTPSISRHRGFGRSGRRGVRLLRRQCGHAYCARAGAARQGGVGIRRDVIRDPKLIFSRSPSALETPKAVSQLEQYEAQLLIEARQVPQLELEPADPKDFRIPARPGAQPDRAAEGEKALGASRAPPAQLDVATSNKEKAP